MSKTICRWLMLPLVVGVLIMGSIERTKAIAFLLPNETLTTSETLVDPGSPLRLDFWLSAVNGQSSYVLRFRYSTLRLWSSNVDEFDSGPDGCNAPPGIGTHQDQFDQVDTNGYAIMQGDGNFVLYDSAGNPAWSTSTHDNDGSYLAMQVIEGYGGHLGIWSPSDVPLWDVCHW